MIRLFMLYHKGNDLKLRMSNFVLWLGEKANIFEIYNFLNYNLSDMQGISLFFLNITNVLQDDKLHYFWNVIWINLRITDMTWSCPCYSQKLSGNSCTIKK